MSLPDSAETLGPPLSPGEVARLRIDTPGVDGQVFLNSAGSSLPPRAVLEAQVAHLAEEAARGGYRAAQEAADRLDAVRSSVAALVGAPTEAVALLGSATEAWRLAFYGFCLDPGDVIITARASYGSNAIAMLQRAGQTGARIEVAPDDSSGCVDLGWIEARLQRGDVRLVCLTHIPTGEGIVNPAEAVGALTRKAGVPYLLDACQSVGQRLLDWEALQCDFLSGTGRKFLRGPRGTGFLVARPRFLETSKRFGPPMLDNRSARWTEDGSGYELAPAALRFEQYEGAIAARLGLGAAIQETLRLGQGRVEHRITALADRLRRALGAIKGVAVHDRGGPLCGIVTFSIAGWSADSVRDALRQDGVETSVSDAESSRFSFGPRGLRSVVRASPHAFNTEAEIDAAASAVEALATRRRP